MHSNIYNIKKLIIYFVITFFVISCSENVQFINTESDNRVYVDCWLSTEQGAIAVLSSTGIAGISTPGLPDLYPDIELSVTDDFQKENHTFIFDTVTKKYYIPKGQFVPVSGRKYEINIKRQASGPQSRFSLTMPEKENIQRFVVSDYQSHQLTDGSFSTSMNFQLLMNAALNGNGYIMLEVSSESDEEVLIDRFLTDESAYRILSSRNAVLVDCSRLYDKSIRMQVSCLGVKPTEYIHIKLHSLSEQTYRYLVFSENAERFPGGNFRNPAIAPLSISNAFLLASFNVSTTNFYQFKLR